MTGGGGVNNACVTLLEPTLPIWAEERNSTSTVQQVSVLQETSTLSCLLCIDARVEHRAHAHRILTGATPFTADRWARAQENSHGQYWCGRAAWSELNFIKQPGGLYFATLFAEFRACFVVIELAVMLQRESGTSHRKGRMDITFIGGPFGWNWVHC
jgi:hypothetical protein